MEEVKLLVVRYGKGLKKSQGGKRFGLESMRQNKGSGKLLARGGNGSDAACDQ